MSGQTSDKPSHAALYLEEQIQNYNQKVEEFREIDKAENETTDPKIKARLKKTREDLYQDLKELYGRIEALCKETSSEFTLELPKRYRESVPRCKRRTVVLGSFGITALIILLRFFKLSQPLELGFYDHLIRFQFNPKPSDKILVIEATDPDIAEQLTSKEAVVGSFSNATLNRVLEKVEELQPIAVGLDIYRDNAPLDPDQDQALKQRFADPNSNLFTVCKSPYTNGEVAPPPGAYRDRVSFSDFTPDIDNVIRRYTLAYDANQNDQKTAKSTCTTNFSLALALASQYLKTQHNIQLENLQNYPSEGQSAVADSDYCLKFTNLQRRPVVFPNFQKYMGGYQRLQDSTRCQVLINYQSEALIKYSLENKANAETITVGEFLSDQEFPKEEYKHRIVLIGSLAYNTLKDYWGTPYTDASGKDMPGVEIQAQMVSQIINAVVPGAGGRPMIWVLPQWNGIQWGEFLWIWTWALAGGFLVRWWRLPKGSVVAIVAACAGGYIVCFLIFQLSGGWFPFVPVVGSLVLTGAMTYWLSWRSVSQDQAASLTHNP